MVNLKHILIEELLNALDDIQRDVPFILNYYMDTDFEADDSIHMDIDLLTMNIMSLRDSANFTKNIICMNNELESNTIMSSPQFKQFALAMFLHVHMLTDSESIYNSGIIGNKNLFFEEY